MKKKCECCDNEIDSVLDDFAEAGWSAYQIPSGNGKVKCFCPFHQIQRKQQMIADMKKYGFKRNIDLENEKPKSRRKTQ